MAAITAPICYFTQDVKRPTFMIHPPSSGRPIDEPPMTQRVFSITDCPAGFEPSESIEVRTLVICPNARRSLHAH